jgi:spore maturation protein B
MSTFYQSLDVVSQWLIPATILLIIVWAAAKRVPMYESLITGAKEGFGIAVMIIPYLVAMLFVIKVFLASGIFDDMKYAIGIALAWAGWGGDTNTLDLIPLAFTKPLTGSGARALMISDSAILRPCILRSGSAQV